MPLVPDPSDKSIELTILMPCLNEVRTLERCIEKAKTFLGRAGIDGEIVIADNGSTDGSQELARRLGARVVDVAERGYGAALYAGSVAARGRFVIMGDSDDSYDFSELDAFVERLRAGDDLVMGNRFRGGILPGAMPWKNRYLGNPVLSGLGRLFFKCPAGDFHCGLRGYRRDAFLRMNLLTTGMEFASEMVIKATLLEMKIAEVPTKLHPDGRDRAPHLRPWRDGWRHLRFMLLFSPRWLFLYPGFAMIVLGTLVGARLTVGPLIVGSVGFDIHTLLFAALAVILGFQGVTFGLFARIYAVNEGLVPRDPALVRLFRWFNLELGVLTGLALVAAGLAGAFAAVFVWSRASYGGLNVQQTMRIVIPAVTAIALGVQLVLSSFFFSVLGLSKRSRS